MKRYDIINYLIQKNGFETYLEIGLSKGSNFNRVRCNKKESCEPFPVDGTEGNVTYRMTSDEMFATVPKDKKWDIIFIDGLHTADSSMRDIVNSLKHLNEGGKVVIHDCLPSAEEYATPEYNPDVEVWNGDVYRTVATLNSKGIRFYTVNTDFGVGVIDYCPFADELEYFEPADIDYGYYIANWRHLMNGVSDKDFEDMEGECFKEHIMLLMGLSRPKNLDLILESVKRVSRIQKNAIMYLIVCGSPRLTDEERDESLKKLFESGLWFQWYNIGQDGYGGTLYNDAMQDFHERYVKTVDCWVYVLDDDNLLCNRVIEKMMVTGQAFPWSRSIHCNGADDCGEITFNSDEYKTYDPSYATVRYSFLKENGFFGNGPAYDSESFKPMLELDHRYAYDSSFNYSATHNAIVDPKWFDRVEAFLKETPALSFFRIQSDTVNKEFEYISGFWKGYAVAFHINDNETIHKILEVIKDYYRKQNIIK